MNLGLRLLLISLLLIGCASTPKTVVKKKTTTPATGLAAKTGKGVPATGKPVPPKAAAPAKVVPPPAPPAEPDEEEHAEEEDDDQFSRIKKYYKK